MATQTVEHGTFRVTVQNGEIGATLKARATNRQHARFTARPLSPSSSIGAGAQSRGGGGFPTPYWPSADPCSLIIACQLQLWQTGRSKGSSRHSELTLGYFYSQRPIVGWMPMSRRLQELLRARIEAVAAPASMQERVGEERDVMHG